MMQLKNILSNELFFTRLLLAVAQNKPASETDTAIWKKYSISAMLGRASYALFSKLGNKWLDEFYEKEIDEIVKIFSKRI